MTRCPFCIELIKDGAYICKHCGRDFLPEFIEYYRPVLESHPELRANTDEAKKVLELSVKNLYLVALTQKKIDMDARLEELEKNNNTSQIDDEVFLRNAGLIFLVVMIIVTGVFYFLGYE